MKQGQQAYAIQQDFSVRKVGYWARRLTKSRAADEARAKRDKLTESMDQKTAT